MKYIIMTGVVLLSASCLASPDVTSREYKLILNHEKFSFDNEFQQVDGFLSLAAKNIEESIDRKVNGSPFLSKERSVAFYDVPRECTLKNIGYSFRDRVTDGDSEVTLKFRSPDRYISGFEDLSSSSSSSKTKFESDIGANAINEFKVIYSYSTRVPNSRKINDMKDINYHFPGFEDDYSFDNNIAIAPVSDLIIHERVYEGLEIDLGSIDAEMSLTLWYLSAPSGQDVPLLAEVDFDYADNSAKYTKKVVNRAKVAFDTLRAMDDWVSPDSETKTQFVYNYDPSFCN